MKVKTDFFCASSRYKCCLKPSKQDPGRAGHEGHFESGLRESPNWWNWADPIPIPTTGHVWWNGCFGRYGVNGLFPRYGRDATTQPEPCPVVP